MGFHYRISRWTVLSSRIFSVAVYYTMEQESRPSLSDQDRWNRGCVGPCRSLALETAFMHEPFFITLRRLERDACMNNAPMVVGYLKWKYENLLPTSWSVVGCNLVLCSLESMSRGRYMRVASFALSGLRCSCWPSHFSVHKGDKLRD